MKRCHHQSGRKIGNGISVNAHFRRIESKINDGKLEVLMLTTVYLTWVSMRKARCLFGIRDPSLLVKMSAKFSRFLPPFLLGVKFAIRALIIILIIICNNNNIIIYLAHGVNNRSSTPSPASHNLLQLLKLIKIINYHQNTHP